MNILIQNGTIIIIHRGNIIRQGAIAIEDGTIVEIGKTYRLKRKYGEGYEKIDARGKVVIPGLINTHQHAAMSVLRGYADDLPLQKWLEEWIWPIEKHMTPHDIYIGALLTAIESIMSGTTTVNTMYHYMPHENEAKAFSKIGLRGVVGHVCFSWRKEDDRISLEHLARDWHNRANGLIRISVDPHASYTVDPEYMRELKEIRQRLNTRYGSEENPVIWHTHVAETYGEQEKIRRHFNVEMKGGVVEYLDSLQVLDKHVVAAHCVALTDREIEIIRRRKVKVSHNPVSNLKLASGISPVPKMIRKGITVSLGTDSPSSNNAADMFETMKVTALIHKGIGGDPTLIPARKVLEMATIEGARSLSWQAEIGSIEKGKKADLAIIDFGKPHLRPIYNEMSHLVYAARPSDVDTVLVNGEIVMENRELTTIDVCKAIDAADKVKTRLLERLMDNIK